MKIETVLFSIYSLGGYRRVSSMKLKLAFCQLVIPTMNLIRYVFILNTSNGYVFHVSLFLCRLLVDVRCVVELVISTLASNSMKKSNTVIELHGMVVK